MLLAGFSVNVNKIFWLLDSFNIKTFVLKHKKASASVIFTSKFHDHDAAMIICMLIYSLFLFQFFDEFSVRGTPPRFPARKASLFLSD